MVLQKANLLIWKCTRHLVCSIRPYDIMLILNKTFHKSFGNDKGNMKAVSDCRWFPPNQKLLKHPFLINDSCCESDAAASSANTTSLSTSSDTAVTLNIGAVDDMAATVLNNMLTERAKTDGAKKAAEKRKQEGHDAVANIRDAKHLTTGVLTANGIHSLSNPKFP